MSVTRAGVYRVRRAEIDGDPWTYYFVVPETGHVHRRGPIAARRSAFGEESYPESRAQPPEVSPRWRPGRGAAHIPSSLDGWSAHPGKTSSAVACRGRQPPGESAPPDFDRAIDHVIFAAFGKETGMTGISETARSARAWTCLCGALLAIALGGCGGGSGGSSSGAATVGDCIDAQNHVVDCGSPSATQKLVSDQSAKNAIACVQIGSNPQVQVRVDGSTFCAEKK